MKTEITRPTWDDIVFESRNKEYGAYPIRKSYDENVSKASLIALLFAAFVFGCLQIASLMHMKIKIPAAIKDYCQLTSPPIIIPNPPTKQPTAKVEQSVNRSLLEKVVTYQVDPVPVKPIETTLPGSEPGTSTGLPSDGIDVGADPIGVPAVIDPPKPLDFAEVMPEYEGGPSAMARFLSRNLHYPSSARMTGVEGSVYIRFVIDGEGKVTDIEVVKGINGALEKEAIRVIALMPRWKPGRQNGHPVSVRRVLPIKFKLAQD